jgi:hypothetical protein
MVGFSVLALQALLGGAAALGSLSIKGSKFYTPDGNQFFIKGTFLTVERHLC